jgi:tRNA threonylcarbamoyladenosine biosynthesis protein TsaE
MEIHINSLQEIDEAAHSFIKIMDGRHIFAFYGGMGAGKTTFIKAVCAELGITDDVTSPSFAIVNEYALPQPGKSLYHFDFYRIKRLSEVYDIGYEDYFYSGNPCFIEWPELIEDLLPDDVVRIHITVNPDESRTLQVDI